MPVNFNDFSAGANVNLNDQIVGFNNTSVGGERKWRVATLSAIFTTNNYFSSVSALWDSTWTTTKNTSTYWDSVYTTTRNASGKWDRSTDFVALSTTIVVNVSANTSSYNNQGTIGTVTLLNATTARAGVMTAEDKYNLVQLLTSWRGTYFPSDSAAYILVAGGGGGGSGSCCGTAKGGGGGGAGGVVNSTFTMVAGNNYIITIGAGGQGGIKTPDTLATNGSNSTISLIAPAAIGGGHGGQTSSAVANPAESGGSGGGAFSFDQVNVGQGTLNQGFSGGRGSTGVLDYFGGGGGGATRFGHTPTALNPSTSGGDGLNWFGLDTFLVGGGGGGGADTSLAGATNGGLGGGGQGANFDQSLSAQNGAIHTGGGGGGTWQSTTPFSDKGGNGGSGCLVIRWSSTSERNLTVTLPASAADPLIVNAGYKYLKIKESCYLSVT